jgi:hypothetical protein
VEKKTVQVLGVSGVVDGVVGVDGVEILRPGLRRAHFKKGLMMDLYGTWHLVQTIGYDINGGPGVHPFGPEPYGVLCFTKNNRMICALCNNAEHLSEKDAPREYSSYGGHFVFDGKVLTTRVDIASDPERMGTDQVRQVSFDGDKMILIPPVRQFRGVTQGRNLIWKKLG